MPRYRRLDLLEREEFSRMLAAGQSVVFAWPEAWVANAEGTTPAARTRYHYLNIEELLQKH